MGLTKEDNVTQNNISESDDLKVTKTINNTDVKYKICTFGSKFHIGFGVPVTIEFDGREYKAKTHKTAKGRIDGLSEFYRDSNIKEGDVLSADYSREQNKITLKRI